MSLAPRHEPAWRVGDSMDRVLDAVRTRSASLRAMPDGSYLTNCLNPGHPDRHPSLHVSHVDTEHGGRVLFKCFSDKAGCSTATQEDWASWAGLDYDDLFDDRRWSMHNRRDDPDAPANKTRRQRRTGSALGRVGPLPARIAHQLHDLLGLPPAAAPALDGPDHEHAWVHVQTYTYRDADDQPIHRVQRQRCTHEGCAEKNFPQQYLRAGGDPDNPRDWAPSKAKAGLPDGWRSVLYRWPQLRQALADGHPVWLLEGEKDVHTAEGLALVATTNPGGAGSFTADHARAFTGTSSVVNVVIDRDPAGRARGVTVHRLLTAAGLQAGQIRVLMPAVTAAKADFTDHVTGGFALEDFEAVALPVLQAWVVVESTVAAATTTVNTAQLELEAQLQVSAHDRSTGRKAAAADRARYAARWAKEGFRAHTHLADAAAQVIALAGQVPATDPHAAWAQEAVDVALTHLRTATGIVRGMYAQTGQLLPTQVEQHQQLVTASADAAPTGELDPGDPAAETPRVSLELIRGGGGGGSGADPRIHIEHDHFELAAGELVQVRWRTLSNGDRVRSYSRIINTELTLAAREFAELDEDIEADNIDLDQLGDRTGRDRATTIRNLPTVSHVVVSVPDGDGGTAKIRVPFDDYETGNFLSHLPVRGLNYSRSRSGRDKVITAITYVSEDVEHLTSYRATGWRRRNDNSWMYIMSGGAIDAHGYQPVPTNLTGVMARFDLPNPTLEATRLREAFTSATAPMMDRFPDRIGAVLIGQAFRASMCANPWVTVLSGSPATGKTGLSAIAQHFYGEMWDRTRPAASMSGNGATANALRIYAHQAKDAVLFLDDNAPTDGVEQAWKRLESVSRLLANQEGRGRAERTGQGVLPDTRPRTSGLITTELPARAGSSGGRRDLLVPLTKRDVRIEDIIALDDMALRHRRALLMASFLQWVAEDYQGNLLRLAYLRDTYATELRQRADVTPRVRERHTDKVAELWAGWGLLLEFLAERDALTSAEHDQWSQRVSEALVLAAEAAEDPDLIESTGQRACELLRYALGNGMAFVADAATGGAPHGLERRLGWRSATPPKDAVSIAMGDIDWRTDPRAIALGHVNLHPEGEESGPELLVERVALEAAIKAAAAQMPDSSSMDLGTVLRALEEEGVLKVRIVHNDRGGQIVRRTLDRTIGCLPSVLDPSKPLREKRIVLRLAELFGEIPPPPFDFEPDPQPTPDPAPSHPAPTVEPDQSQQPTAEPMLELDDPQVAERADTMSSAQTNAGGLTVTGIPHFTGLRPCARCGMRCGVEYAGHWLHTTCFWATTAGDLAGLHTEIASWTTPVAPATHTAPSPPAADTTSPTSHAPAASGSTGQPRPATGRREKALRASQFTAAVCVVDVDRVWLPDGTSRPLPAPITHLGQLEELGRSLRIGQDPIGWRTYPQAGTVVPTRALWEQLGVPVGDLPALPSRRAEWLTQISADLPALTQAVAHGWVFGRGEGAPQLKATTRLRQTTAARGAIRILMTACTPADCRLGDDVAPAAIARRLQLYAETVGVGFGASPISTGLDLFEAIAPRNVREALTPVDWSAIPPAHDHRLESQFDWTRKPLHEEATKPWLVCFDRGQSYFATWSGLLLGMGAPTHHPGPVTFDEKVAGWWRITLPDNTIDGHTQALPYPDLLDPDGTQHGRDRWVTTPALGYAVRAMGMPAPVVHEAWLWPKDRCTRVLDPLYKRLRPALAALQALQVGDGDPDAKAAETMVKFTYKQLSGYFTSDQAAATKSGMHQPYWFHAMIAQARVAMLHQILTIGQDNLTHGRPNVWPLVVSNIDMIGYAADDLDTKTSWPGDPSKLGIGPGSYKPARYAPLPEHAKKYLTGRGWSGREATTRFDEHGEPQ